MAEASTPDKIEQIAYSIADVSQKIGISERSIQRLIASGVLPSIKAGRRRLIPRASLAKWLNGGG